MLEDDALNESTLSISKKFSNNDSDNEIDLLSYRSNTSQVRKDEAANLIHNTQQMLSELY